MRDDLDLEVQKQAYEQNQWSAQAVSKKAAPVSRRVAAPQHVQQAVQSSLLRGERLDGLVEQTQELEKLGDFFNAHSRRSRVRAGFNRHPTPAPLPAGGGGAASQDNMGVLFRSSRHNGSVWFGKRTVKDGESLAVWDVHGRYEVVAGPERRWMFMSRFSFMDRHVANASQYLIIQHRDGSREHRRGPAAIFSDPIKHVSVTVMPAVNVNAYEVIVVYTEDPNSPDVVKRDIVRGPTVFVPSPDQWLHVFRWHGSDPDDIYTKIPGALTFTKLATIPDQLYYNAVGVRTSDDATLTIKVMIFYSLVDLETMLNTTHDPIADFCNAALADLMNFGSKHTYEDFIGAASHLSELSTFAVLTSRAAAIGYKVSKVVYRGYSASDALQELCDRAIRTRVELKLKQEEQENAVRMQDLALRSSIARGAEEREQESTRAAHQRALTAAAAQAELARQREAAEQALALEKAKDEAARTRREAEAEQALKYLAGLRQLGVELTPTLLASMEPKPDRVIQLLGVNGAPAGRDAPAGAPQVALHLTESAGPAGPPPPIPFQRRG